MRERKEGEGFVDLFVYFFINDPPIQEKKREKERKKERKKNMNRF